MQQNYPSHGITPVYLSTCTTGIACNMYIPIVHANDDVSPPDHEGLTSGQIAGIVIGCLAVAGLIFFIIHLHEKKKKGQLKLPKISLPKISLPKISLPRVSVPRIRRRQQRRIDQVEVQNVSREPNSVHVHIHVYCIHSELFLPLPNYTVTALYLHCVTLLKIQ